MEHAGAFLQILYNDAAQGCFYLPAYVEELLKDVE